MEVVNVTVVDTPEVVAVNVAVGFGTVVNSDLTYSATVNSGDTFVVADTIVKNTLGTTILTQPSATNTGVIADSVVTNSDNTFSMNVPAETNPVLADITHIDSDLTPVVLPAMTPMVCTPAATPEGWYPPADWGWNAASALINDGDNGFVALFMAFPDMENYINFVAYFTGTGSVDWGDGSVPQAVTSGVNTYATLDYDNIPNGVVASIGCKIAVVKFTCTSTFISLNLSTSHPEANATTPTNWLAMKIRTSGTIIGLTTSQKYGTKCIYLHLLDLGSALLASTSVTYALSYLKSLKKIKWDGFEPNNVNKESLFIETCLSPFCNIMNGLGWQYVTKLSTCFSNSFGLSSINITIPNCTTIYSAFAGAAINSVKLTNTGNVTSINNCCFGAYINSFDMDNCAAITNTTNFTYIGYNFFRRLILSGLTVGISIVNGEMSASALNAFFTSLGTANGAQTITITGNPGAATCDTSIATAKGFTVVT